jgi:hypothetical protein
MFTIYDEYRQEFRPEIVPGTYEEVVINAFDVLIKGNKDWPDMGMSEKSAVLEQNGFEIKLIN